MERKNIFICDDHKGILEMLETVITEFTKARVSVETDSRNVFARLINERPDILIVDISMPWISGDQLIKDTRSNPVLKDMFIICMSANHNGEATAVAAGADVFLPKPFDMEQVLSLINGIADTG